MLGGLFDGQLSRLFGRDFDRRLGVRFVRTFLVVLCHFAPV